MEELIEKLSRMNSAEMQQFCELDENADEPAAFKLESCLLGIIGSRLDSETFGDEDEETVAENLLRQCVEAMDIPTTLGLILTLQEEDSE